MIVGLGIDITEVDRIEKAIQRHGQRFLRRILPRPRLNTVSPRLMLSSVLRAASPPKKRR